MYTYDVNTKVHNSLTTLSRRNAGPEKQLPIKLLEYTYHHCKIKQIALGLSQSDSAHTAIGTENGFTSPLFYCEILRKCPIT